MLLLVIVQMVIYMAVIPFVLNFVCISHCNYNHFDSNWNRLSRCSSMVTLSFRSAPFTFSNFFFTNFSLFFIWFFSVLNSSKLLVYLLFVEFSDVQEEHYCNICLANVRLNGWMDELKACVCVCVRLCACIVCIIVCQRTPQIPSDVPEWCFGVLDVKSITA